MNSNILINNLLVRIKKKKTTKTLINLFCLILLFPAFILAENEFNNKEGNYFNVILIALYFDVKQNLVVVYKLK